MPSPEEEYDSLSGYLHKCDDLFQDMLANAVLTLFYSVLSHHLHSSQTIVGLLCPCCHSVIVLSVCSPHHCRKLIIIINTLSHDSEFISKDLLRTEVLGKVSSLHLFLDPRFRR